ncbi:unnamed protein product [Ceutorhynchus assimilis]|uniref:Uncharacterized protein n=1 Tax=Ceutorhynchus assimilis TaxID=467358 RepID=A0A9N9MGQ8_9CUCU|nr:unnamed protein product [Ceutorhynchus assimilis]
MSAFPHTSFVAGNFNIGNDLTNHIEKYYSNTLRHNLKKTELEEEGISELKNRIDILVQADKNLKHQLLDTTSEKQVLEHKLRVLEDKQSTAKNLESPSVIIDKLERKLEVHEKDKLIVEAQYEEERQQFENEIIRLKNLNCDLMSSIRDLETQNSDYLNQIDYGLKAIAVKARQAQIWNINLEREIHEALNLINEMNNNEIVNSCLSDSTNKAHSGLPRNISPDKNRALLLTDNYGFRLSDNLSDALEGTGSHLQIVSKPQATFAQVIHNTGQLSREFGENDFLVVLASMNGITQNEDVLKLIRSTDHTNVILCTIPVSPNDQQFNRIYKNNKVILSSKFRLSYTRSKMRILDVSSLLDRTSYFSKLLSNRNGRIRMANLIGQLLVRVFPLVGNKTQHAGVESVKLEDVATENLWVRINTLRGNESEKKINNVPVTDIKKAANEDQEENSRNQINKNHNTYH